MKNLFKFIGIVALVAAIGFSMTGCPTESKSDSNPTPSPTPEENLKLTLTNVAVTITDNPDSTDFGYIWDSDAHDYKPLSSYITGTPKAQITMGGAGGTLTLELDKPKDAALSLPSASFFNGATVTPSTAKFFNFNTAYFSTSDGTYFLQMVGPADGGLTRLFYVDVDVTVNGTTNGGWSFTNITLKKGWNFVPFNNSTSVGGPASQTQPSGATWTVMEND